MGHRPCLGMHSFTGASKVRAIAGVKRMKSSIRLCVIPMLLTASASADVVLLSDDFDAESGGITQLNYDTFANWSISEGTVDLIGGDGPHAVLGREGMYVDLDGSTRDAGVMISKSSWLFEPGVEYVLEFELAGVNDPRFPADDVRVAIGGGHLAKDISVGALDPFTAYSFSFFGNGAAGSISFANGGGDNGGATLDSVVLRQVVVVPLPAGGWAGLAGVAIVVGVRQLSRSRRTG